MPVVMYAKLPDHETSTTIANNRIAIPNPIFFIQSHSFVKFKFIYQFPSRTISAGLVGGSKPPPYILDVPYSDPTYKETLLGAGQTVCQRRLAAKFMFVKHLFTH